MAFRILAPVAGGALLQARMIAGALFAVLAMMAPLLPRSHRSSSGATT